jgi:predicted site-specific integrase-resolvase
MKALPYPPPYQDIETLCAHLSVSPSTVEAWMKIGKLPPPKVRTDGKRLWKWIEVERALDGWEEHTQESGASLAEKITHATRRIAAESR